MPAQIGTVGAPSVVFLVDVDNTLLDNDRIRDDFQKQLTADYGEELRNRYWAIQEELFVELGYRDYLGAVERLWRETHDPRVLRMSSFLVDFPFADYVYPGARAALDRLRVWGPTVILTDGDAVYQPLKVARSGILDAVDGNLLVYVHKERELDDIERRFPAEHYVLVDDKPAILAAVKQRWGARVTTVLPRQGQFANEPEAQEANPSPDVMVESIGDLTSLSPDVLLGLSRVVRRRPGRPTA